MCSTSIDIYGFPFYISPMPSALSLAGRQFGKLRVVSRCGISPHGKTTWNVVCVCGTRCVVIGTQLISGATKSCGCLQRESVRRRNWRHGAAIRGKQIPEYRIWSHLWGRCTNESDSQFKYYGG